MTKFRHFNSFFGNLSYIFAHGFFCDFDKMKKLIEIFKLQKLVISVTALDQTSKFFETVSTNKSDFEVIIPQKSTIVSETLIITDAVHFLPTYKLLLKSEPRCISIYSVSPNSTVRLNYEDFIHANDNIVKNKNVDCGISIVIEECFMTIVFKKETYNVADLFKTIKRKLS